MLSKNRVSDSLFGSHSGMTAEGDNKVLMQKVVKDIFAHTQKKLHDTPKFSKGRLAELQKTQILSMENMRDMIFMREGFEVKHFGKILQKKIMKEGRNFYDVWMFESNEDIQNLALAFGERYFLSHAWKAFENCKHQGAKALLGKIIRLYMIDYLNKELAFYLTNDLMAKEFAQQVQAELT